MALIKKQKGRRDGGYTRLLGNQDLGYLLSKVQAAVISSGSELENIIAQKVGPRRLVLDIDHFLDSYANIAPDTYIAPKKTLKKSKKLSGSGVEPDFLIIRHLTDERVCIALELKDGETFDTKKARGEVESLKRYTKEIATRIPYKVEYRICSFNAQDKTEIVKGFKSAVAPDKVWTGRMLCKELKIDYEEIVKLRAADQVQNLEYFRKEIARIFGFST